MKSGYIILDIETTGLSTKDSEITEIGVLLRLKRKALYWLKNKFIHNLFL